MTRTRILLVAAALAAVPASTFAGDDPKPSGSTWDAFAKKFDLDADGRVTWEEYQKVLTGFAGLDKNRDGVITKEEVPADGGAFLEALAFGGPLGALDGGTSVAVPAWGGVQVLGADGDEEGGCFGGVCTGVDAAKTPWIGVAMLGAAADTDHDGAVTTAEWELFLTSLHADGTGVVSTEALQKALPEVPAAAAALVLGTLLDVDKDGKVELDDLRAAFTAADTNRVGRVDAQDKPAKPEAR
jgi:hypothetical protein